MKRFLVTVTALSLSFLSVRAAADVPTDPMQIRPLLVGAQIPDVGVRTADGEETTLHAVLGDGPAVLVVYRGGW